MDAFFDGSFDLEMDKGGVDVGSWDPLYAKPVEALWTGGDVDGQGEEALPEMLGAALDAIEADAAAALAALEAGSDALEKELERIKEEMQERNDAMQKLLEMLADLRGDDEDDDGDSDRTAIFR
jgi:hypothetical protein